MSKHMLALLSLASISSAAVVSNSATNTTYAPPLAIPPQNLQNSPGFIDLPLTRKATRALAKRQSIDPLENDISGYSIQIGLGTPSQLVWVDLDTGSNELWVNPDCGNSYWPQGCEENGDYEPGSSSTSHGPGGDFSIQYGIGTVSGSYYTDNMNMGGASISAQQFGDASTSESLSQGILGIAYGNGIDTNYNNVIDNLAYQRIIQSKAFGLALGSIDDAGGSIIFGGIDVGKFSGPLQKQPIIPRSSAPDHYARYWFYMNQVTITPPGASRPIQVTGTTYSQPMFPDSGSTFCQLPSDLFNKLLFFFPQDRVNQGSNTYTVSCAYRDLPGYINFKFGSVTVSVSYHEFIWFDGAQCWFAAQPSTQFFLLGDSFMRSAYIVYDQDNANIHIAPAANCGQSIIAISTGSNAVPSAVGVCPPTYTPPVQAPPTPATQPISTKAPDKPIPSSTPAKPISMTSIEVPAKPTSSPLSSRSSTHKVIPPPSPSPSPSPVFSSAAKVPLKSTSSPKPSSRSSTRKVDPVFVLPSIAPVSCAPNTQTQTVTVTSVSVVTSAAAAVTVTVTSYTPVSVY